MLARNLQGNSGKPKQQKCANLARVASASRRFGEKGFFFRDLCVAVGAFFRFDRFRYQTLAVQPSELDGEQDLRLRAAWAGRLAVGVCRESVGKGLSVCVRLSVHERRLAQVGTVLATRVRVRVPPAVCVYIYL